MTKPLLILLDYWYRDTDGVVKYYQAAHNSRPMEAIDIAFLATVGFFLVGYIGKLFTQDKRREQLVGTKLTFFMALNTIAFLASLITFVVLLVNHPNY